MKLKTGLLLSLVLMIAPAAEAAVNVTINGTTYSIPQRNEKGWGDNVTSWIQAASTGLLQKSGGTFTLTAEVDFGASFGISSPYLKSKTANISTAGVLRLANTDAIGWRNNANGANLLLGVDASDRLTYNGNPLIGSAALTASRALESNASGVITASTITSTELGHLSGVTSSLCGVTQTCTITDKTIDADDNTISNLVDANIGAAAAIARTKIATGTANRLMVNADVTGAVSEAAAITAARVLISDANGIPTHSAVTETTLGYLDATSSIQTQIDSKQATGNYITALTSDVTASGPGSVAATIANDAVTNAKAANMAESTIKGRAAGAGTGDPTDLTATQATAILNNFVGDSGSGGTKGLVPAPAAGDAAAEKYLKADGTWAAVVTAGGITSDAAGARKLGIAQIECDGTPTAVSDEDNMVDSVTGSSGAGCTVNFTSGFFTSGTPNCVVTAFDNSGSIGTVITTASISSISSTAVVVYRQIYNEPAAAVQTQDGNFFLSCMGNG